MAEVGSPTGSVQTRYSFYNVSDPDNQLLFESSFLPNGSNGTSNENNRVSLPNTNKTANDAADGNDDNDDSNDNDENDNDNSNDGEPSLNYHEHKHDTTNSDCNSVNDSVNEFKHHPDLSLPRVEMQMHNQVEEEIAAEDILRSLKETEDLGLHKGTLTRRNSNNEDKPGSAGSDNGNDNAGTPAATNNQQHSSFYEKAVKEALQHIRLRAQRRTALIKAGAPTATATHEFNNNNNNNNNIQSSDDTNTAGQEQIDAMLLAKEEQWKSHRTQMANYVSAKLSTIDANNNSTTLPPIIPRNTISGNGNIPELGSTSISGSGSCSTSNGLSQHVLPLPLHPSIDPDHVLMPSTKNEDRLLSPPADVRKAVEGAAASLFRDTQFDHPSSSSSSNNNSNVDFDSSNQQQQQQHGRERNKTTATDLASNFNVLQIANPVYSLPGAMHGGDSPMHGNITAANAAAGTSDQGAEVGGGISSSPFIVVPSSPAPGKFLATKLKAGQSTTSTSNNYYSNSHSNQHHHHNPNHNNYANTNNMSHNTENHMAAASQQRQIELEMERRWRREEEIERGVEQVLLAILNAASASSTTSPSTENENLNDGVVGASGEEDVGKELIENVFTNLLSSPFNYSMTGGGNAALKMRPVRTYSDGDDPSDDPHHSQPQYYPIHHHGKEVAEGTTRCSTAKSESVVDELLAETDDGYILPQSVVDDSGTDEEVLDKSAHDLEEEVKNNASIRPYTVEADGTLEVEAVDRGHTRQSSDGTTNTTTTSDNFDEGEDETSDEVHSGEDDDDDDETNVLGRLSKVGTTGVVLDDGRDDDTTSNDDDEGFSEHNQSSSTAGSTGAAAMKKMQSPSLKIIESITSAVRHGPILKLGGGGNDKMISSTSKSSPMEEKDQLQFGGGPNHHHNEEQLSPRKTSLPQIKMLYSHMLPYTSNKPHIRGPSFNTWFTEKLGSVFSTKPAKTPWDDQDPEELGYIIHKYSRSQLQMIEQDYEDLMKRLNKKYDIAAKKGQIKVVKKKSGLNNSLERDLSEAEKILKQSPPKRGRDDALTRGGSSRRSLSNSSDGANKGLNKHKMSNAKQHNMVTNPNFPNAKHAGSGDVGELEIYHLPIIYKAHQTGFEPTKDLVLQPDSVFAGNYYVQSELGSAAFSTAYRCVDLNSGKKGEDGETYYDEVCLKVIKNTKDFFDQSLDEIKILELLRQTNQCHENNILEMKTFFYHKEHLIIVTELLRQNLFEFGKYITDNDEPRYFTRDRLCYITRQCLVALSFVHKLGLVHSDIKPENILLASYSRARIKVIDFGSSCYLTDRQSSYIQSRSYRAPEVILGLPYSGKIDIWSLGCVIAEMYTGQVTFQNDSVVSMLSRIEAICGAFPRHMIENGRQSGQFFTPTGLLYEKADADDESEARHHHSHSRSSDDESSSGDSEIFHVFQPKITNMAERLGFDPLLTERKRANWEHEEKVLFVDFVTKMLTIDPDKRPTADEALAHPWMLSGCNLSEEDLKYPPED